MLIWTQQRLCSSLPKKSFLFECLKLSETQTMQLQIVKSQCHDFMLNKIKLVNQHFNTWVSNLLIKINLN